MTLTAPGRLSRGAWIRWPESDRPQPAHASLIAFNVPTGVGKLSTKISLVGLSLSLWRPPTQRAMEATEMPKRIDFPLGGMRRKRERQDTERERRERRRKLDRVTEAFERRTRSLDRSDRTWRKALRSRRAPFPGRS